MFAAVTLKSIGQTSRLKIQAEQLCCSLNTIPSPTEYLCCSLKTEFLLYQGTSILALKAFSELNELSPPTTHTIEVCVCVCVCVCVLVAQSCPTLCNLMDCSPPGSSAHRILQARILEWVSIPFSRIIEDNFL